MGAGGNAIREGDSLPLVCRACEAIAEGETIAAVANRAATETSGRDLLLVLAGGEPSHAIVETLRDAAASDSTAATVSPLAAAGVAHADLQPAFGGDTSAGGSRAICRVSLVLAPYVYVTRAAFDLLGGLDESFRGSPEAVADFGMRAAARGLANLASAWATAQEAAWPSLGEEERATLAERFGELSDAAEDPPAAALERCLAIARMSAHRLSVTIDARSLGYPTGGTQVYVHALVRALAATDRVQVRALVGDGHGTAALDDIEGVSTLTYEQAIERATPTDIVHRPQQVFTLDDVELLRPLGKRLLVTHLDLIAYHNPTYFDDIEEWRRHVRTTHIVFGVADHVLFTSAHARQDAEREDLLEEGRASVVPLGVDLDGTEGPSQLPPQLERRNEPFLLCLGADYAHKNRPFALELLARLKSAHSWDGILVLAGAHVDNGSSSQDERRALALRPELAEAVIDLGPVTEPQRRWLTSHARAVVYPTTVEGFGLVPFEAAAAGTPCLYAAQSSLAELLPTDQAVIAQWDAHSSAARALPLLVDGQARRTHVEALMRHARSFDWDRCAHATVDVCERAFASPARLSARQGWEGLQREQRLGHLESKLEGLESEHRALLANLGPNGIAAFGPHGSLSIDERRVLLALASRPSLSRPVFAAARLGYRLARRGEHAE